MDNYYNCPYFATDTWTRTRNGFNLAKYYFTY